MSIYDSADRRQFAAGFAYYFARILKEAKAEKDVVARQQLLYAIPEWIDIAKAHIKNLEATREPNVR